VCVRLVDGFGGRDFVEHLQAPLDAADVNVQIYRREVGPCLARHRLRRLHRKIAVIDGRLAFVGGINIISDLDPSRAAPRLDYSVRIEGPLVRPIHGTVTHAGTGRLGLVPAAPSAGLRPLPPAAERRHRGRLPHPRQPPSPPRHRGRLPRRHRRGAQRIILANAYFLPGRRFRQAPAEGRRPGVRVTLLTQGWTDHLQQYATRALYGQFLAHGVRIFNTTAAICTPRWRWSTNTGPPSARPTSTRSACCWPGRPTSSSATRALRPTSNGVSSGPSPPAPARSPRRLATRPRLQRILNWGAYGLVRLMIGIAGYGNRH
jgi:cardiolipin synthase